LHDTPARELFTKAVRAFSHGCIRIEKPLDLAAYVLRGTPQWTREALLTAIAEGKERLVQAPQPLPIYVGYWTAWVEEDDIVHFRHDSYGRDRRLDAAFDHARSWGPWLRRSRHSSFVMHEQVAQRPLIAEASNRFR